MKSVRLDAALRARLAAAAASRGISESEFIRESIAAHCDEVLGAESLYDRVRDLIGSVHGGGGLAEHHDEVIADILERDFERQKAGRRRTAAS